MSGLVMKLKIDPVGAPDNMAGFMDQVTQKGPDVHRKWVFRVLEYTIKYSRVATGRSRAAWFPLMDLYGFDYQRSLGPARTDGGEVAAGYSQGTFTDEPFHTSVMNNVNYVGFVNSRWGLFAPDRVTPAKGQLQALKGMKLVRGLMFEEKIPQFEQFGADTWADFIDHAKAAFEQKGGPGEIQPQDVPPPMGM